MGIGATGAFLESTFTSSTEITISNNVGHLQMEEEERMNVRRELLGGDWFLPPVLKKTPKISCYVLVLAVGPLELCVAIASTTEQSDVLLLLVDGAARRVC